MRRRTCSAFLAILFLFPLAEARAALPREDVMFAGAVQIAEADWLVKEGRRIFWYFAAGLRFADPLYGIEAYGYVGRATCKKGRGFIVCSGRASEHEVSLDDFWVEPDLSSGHLHIETPRAVHDVRWEQDDIIEPFVFAEATAHYGFAAGGAYRWAPATGSVMGKSLQGREDGVREHFGVVAEYAEAGLFVPGRSFRVRPDGSLIAKARFEIP